VSESDTSHLSGRKSVKEQQKRRVLTTAIHKT